MQRTPVSSSTVAEIGYTVESRILEVLFKNGGLYQYFDVPPQEHEALMQSGSIGQYLNTAIKGKFRYARV